MHETKCGYKHWNYLYTFSDGTKAIPSLKNTKESPSGGEKLLRLLASGSSVPSESQLKGNQPNTQANNKMPLNFAQGIIKQNFIQNFIDIIRIDFKNECCHWKHVGHYYCIYL